MNFKARTPRRALHAKVDQETRHELLQFIFDSHLSLFNTRRDHEWRVIISAMVLMGAVDATMLSKEIRLDGIQIYGWWGALLTLVASIGWYQWGVQVRNRVDRVAMDHVLVEICNALDIGANNPIRVGIDRENERILGVQIDIIMHRTYLWAFLPQMFVLLIACVLSGYLPYLINGLPRNETAGSAQPKPGATVSSIVSLRSAAPARPCASPPTAPR